MLSSYISLTETQDIFCVAMHDRHAALLGEALRGKKLILSFFEDRFPVSAHSKALDMLSAADYIVVDSRKNANKLQQAVGKWFRNIMVIPPYDTRVDLSISGQFAVQKILVPVDDIEDEVFDALIHFLGKYLLLNEKARIHLLTRRSEYDRKQKVLEHVRKVLGGEGLEEDWAAMEEDKGQVAENDLDPEESVPVKFFVEQCMDELSISKCMREQRVLVDLRKVPELFLQITAISIGIPQIVRTRTEFVEHGKNGFVLKRIKNLPEVLNYYLDGMSGWNRARVYSYELVREYSTEQLLDKWGEVLESVGGDSYLTVGRKRLE